MLWFSPKCPVDEETRLWLNECFDWLIQELGKDTLEEVDVILPTHDFFPDSYDGSRADIRKMVHRVCEYMDVEPELIELGFYEHSDASDFHPFAEASDKAHAVGTYQMRADGKYLIRLETKQAANPEMLVATIAHELGHVILLGEGRLPEDYEYHEQMTDLVTVFYGLGIFKANSSMVFEQWTNSQYQGWRIGGSGYLSEEVFGYALALFCFHRNELKPAWAKYLNTNVRSFMKQSIKFLLVNKK